MNTLGESPKKIWGGIPFGPSSNPLRDESLVPQALHRIKLRGAGGRDGPKDDPDNGRHHDADNRRQPGNRKVVVGEEAYREWNGEAGNNARDASAERDQNGLRQKLEADGAVGGADGFANPNLADARRHRRQHD